MQTFLPYPDFEASAQCLDRLRLGKQRVEVLQLLNSLLLPEAGWKSHPASKMWKGHEVGLATYGLAICDEWIARGYNDTCLGKISQLVPEVDTKDVPTWFGTSDFHAAHRSNLLRKDPTHYGKFGWTEDATLPYLWPNP